MTEEPTMLWLWERWPLCVDLYRTHRPFLLGIEWLSQDAQRDRAGVGFRELRIHLGGLRLDVEWWG